MFFEKTCLLDCLAPIFEFNTNSSYSQFKGHVNKRQVRFPLSQEISMEFEYYNLISSVGRVTITVRSGPTCQVTRRASPTFGFYVFHCQQNLEKHSFPHYSTSTQSQWYVSFVSDWKMWSYNISINPSLTLIAPVQMAAVEVLRQPSQNLLALRFGSKFIYYFFRWILKQLLLLGDVQRVHKCRGQTHRAQLVLADPRTQCWNFTRMTPRGCECTFGFLSFCIFTNPFISVIPSLSSFCHCLSLALFSSFTSPLRSSGPSQNKLQ